MNKIFVSVLLLLASTAVWAQSVTFTQINNNQNNLDLSGQLSMEISDAGAGLVDFTFKNNVGTPSSILNIYFGVFGSALPVLTNITVQSQTAGVNFVNNGATPTGMPQGIAQGFTTVYGIDSEKTGQGQNDVSAQENGIDISTENLVLRGTYNTSTFSTYALMLASLTQTGGVGLVLHNSSGNGGKGSTDHYLSFPTQTPNAVPVPAAAWLFATALGLFGFARRRNVS
jgi:hypothetical protein